MTWIKVEEELPIQQFRIRVKNGRKIYYAYYYRKKWYSWGRKLHKVSEWEKCPVMYPKISPKDLRAYLKRVEKYKHQMQSSKFTTRPIIGLFSGDNLNSKTPESFLEEMEREFSVSQ